MTESVGAGAEKCYRAMDNVRIVQRGSSVGDSAFALAILQLSHEPKLTTP